MTFEHRIDLVMDRILAKELDDVHGCLELFKLKHENAKAFSAYMMQAPKFDDVLDLCCDVLFTFQGHCTDEELAKNAEYVRLRDEYRKSLET